MTDANEAGSKVHYICQTYVKTTNGPNAEFGLKVDKQFEYTTSQEAESRAEREFKSDGCVGADAYMLVEDENSGEVGEPTFIVRFGSVPESEGY
ncbi:hypothetical protein [Sulfitobacter sp.]|uniref:hypothetical protein n=1 Tax=Sulfitobacter sp. TaxID=1903071 RepID=UPI0030031B78